MSFGEDFNIDKILSELKGLFGPKEAPKQNSPTIMPAAFNDPVPGDIGYQAPLRGSWQSSGGFDPVSMRPNGRKGHMGVDMRAPIGTPIYPLAPGIITSVGTDPIGGNVVNIRHADGIRTYYAHLSTARVFKGDKVNKDTVIGTVGTTGNASTIWPHLHFQVWDNNQIQDPAKYFSVPKYTNLNSQEKQQGKYLSEEAKEQARAFNMKRHVSHPRTTLARNADSLVKIANQFYKLASD